MLTGLFLKTGHGAFAETVIIQDRSLKETMSLSRKSVKHIRNL